MPCHPARARKLLKLGKAAVYRFHPFTIILLERAEGETQRMQLKFDPGSKITGIALVLFGEKKKQLVWAANLACISHHPWEKAYALFFEAPSKFSKGRFVNLSKRTSWMDREIESANFYRSGEKCRLDGVVI